MSKREELLRLAERVEAATGADRKLDYLIFCECVPMGDRAYWEPDNLENRFTASLDAAMTLVPEGWAWALYSDASCEIGREPERGCILQPEFITDGATLALALCAAALRARAAEAGE